MSDVKNGDVVNVVVVEDKKESVMSEMVVEKKVVKKEVGGVEFVEKDVKMLVKKGKGVWFCLWINGKKYVMREVDKFYWEGGGSGDEGINL
jgi:hypothetical protein